MTARASNGSDEEFIAALKRSVAHVEHVATWLRTFEKHVIVPETRIRDSVKNRKDFADNGDLIVDGRRCEAKERLDLDFRSRDQFAKKYSTIIVSVVHVWDDAKVKPFRFFITNKTWTGCIVVKGSTRSAWVPVWKYDRFKKAMRWFYECPIELTEYHPIGHGVQSPPT